MHFSQKGWSEKVPISRTGSSRPGDHLCQFREKVSERNSKGLPLVLPGLPLVSLVCSVWICSGFICRVLQISVSKSRACLWLCLGVQDFFLVKLLVKVVSLCQISLKESIPSAQGLYGSPLSVSISAVQDHWGFFFPQKSATRSSDNLFLLQTFFSSSDIWFFQLNS